MNELTREAFVYEIHGQAQSAGIAIYQINSSLQAEQVPEVIAGVQALLSAAAMLSKIFWPVGTKRGEAPADTQRRLQRGVELRELFAVSDNSAIKGRGVRNAFEHYDERLDEFDFENGITIDRSVGDPSTYDYGAAYTVLRNFNPETTVASVLGVEVDTAELWVEIQRVGAMAGQLIRTL